MPMPSDNEVVRDYVVQFLPKDTKQKLEGKSVEIIYAPYDWALNEDLGATALSSKAK